MKRQRGIKEDSGGQGMGNRVRMFVCDGILSQLLQKALFCNFTVNRVLAKQWTNGSRRLERESYR